MGTKIQKRASRRKKSVTKRGSLPDLIVSIDCKKDRVKPTENCRKINYTGAGLGRGGDLSNSSALFNIQLEGEEATLYLV